MKKREREKKIHNKLRGKVSEWASEWMWERKRDLIRLRFKKNI